MGYIYKIHNNINNKEYIGLTTRDIKRRWYEHIYYANEKNNNGHCRLIQKAIKKYGISNFSFSILEKCENNLLNEKEKYYIKLFHTYVKEGGYNLTYGGEGNIKIDREKVVFLWEKGYSCGEIAKELKSWTRVISDILKNYYKEDITDEIKKRGLKKLSDFHKKEVKQYDASGKLIKVYPSFKETGILNIDRAVKTGIKSAGFYWIGESSPYTIEELINNERPNPKNKPVAQYNLNQELLNTFSSLKEAVKKTGIIKIGEVCNGNRKTAGGFIWKYIR